MKFRELALYLEKLEKTSSRITITKILADLFGKVPNNQINMTVNMLLGRLAPNYQNVVFNLADKMIVKAIAQAYDKNIKEVTATYKRLGDLGLAAEIFGKHNKVNTKLTVSEVFFELKKVADFEGEGSQNEKINNLASLIRSVGPLSAKFVARVPAGKLRLGFSDKTIIDALSWMVAGDKSLSKQISSAYEVMSDPGFLAEGIKKNGVKKTVRGAKPVVGVPVLPMLAQRLKSPDEMIKKMGKVVVEPKYDGLRILIHFKRGKFVKTFTRNLNETSWMFPEIEKIGDVLRCDEAILDSEAVGLDESTKKMANFQTTMTRRRKHRIGDTRKKVSIQFYIFDILSKDKKNLMKSPQSERRKVLEQTLQSNKVFKIINQSITNDPDFIRKEHLKLIERGLEGVIVKRSDSTYVPGRTGWRWVKMKEVEEAQGKLSDTLDCVIMGYSRGKGKRAGFGIGQFLAGVRKGEKIKTITKVGTGLTDEQLETLAKRLKKIVVKTNPKEYEVHKNLEPDFWVEPSVVVELAGDELTKSPNHSSGYALRFPRLIRFRDDKGLLQATKLQEVTDLFKIQTP
ncbi:ATP-dependent DNA ligase [Patescibacteria group bacterium]